MPKCLRVLCAPLYSDTVFRLLVNWGVMVGQDLVMQLGSDMLMTAASLAAPFLFSSLAVGLLVSVIQVATQIQEMTLTFVPKIIVAVVVVLTMGAGMLSMLVEYTKRTFQFAIGL